MKVYDLMDAIGDLESLMNEAWIEGPVGIHQRLGRDFLLMPWNVRPPLDALEGVDELFEDWDDDDDWDEDEFGLDVVGIPPRRPGPMNGKAA